MNKVVRLSGPLWRGGGMVDVWWLDFNGIYHKKKLFLNLE